MQYLVFWLLFFNLPTSARTLKSSFGSLSVLLFNWTIAITFQVWVYWRGTSSGLKAGCDAKIFLFAPIDAYSHKWITASRVLDTMGVVGALAACCGAVALAITGLTSASNWQDEEVAPSGKRAPVAAGWTLMLMSEGAIGIAFIEMTIKVNNIEFPDTPLTDSGQLIPLLIGVLTLASVFWEEL